MAILLIGSTGNGKSTLGNFLLNPDGEQVFKMARDNKPQTQFVKPVAKNVSVKGAGRVDLTVIDTPGLNESAAKDLGHMIEIIKSLKGFVHVRACIIVVKFNTKIDAQYKATVQYYSKLLPSLFAKNVTIVMTDYATDPRSEAVRERQGIDVRQIKENTIKEIVACAGLGYDPFLFTIDCLPFDEEEKAINGQVREALLQYIHSQKPIKVADLKVAKTADIKSADNERVKEYNGEVTGYNLRLQEADAAAKEALAELESKEAEITTVTQSIEALQSNLDDKNSSESVDCNSWSVSEEWRAMRWFSKSYDLKSKWKIEEVDKWDNGHCKWKHVNEDDYQVKGKLEGQFMRGIYARITVKTSKRIKFATEIQILQNDIARERQQMTTLKVQREQFGIKHREHIKQLELLQRFIDKRREDIKALSREYLSIEEAEGRLKEMKKRH